MSEFDDAFAESAVESLMREFGDPVEFIDESSQSSNMTAIVGEVKTEHIQTDEGIEKRRTRSVSVTTDPDSQFGGIAGVSLNMRSVFKINQELWAIDSIQNQSKSMVEYNTEHVGIVERSSRDYRSEG